MIKRAYGNVFTRLLSGGVTLSSLEQAVLAKLIGALPPELQEPFLAQLDGCNLVQRESDGRALNFYKKQGGRVTRAHLPDLPVNTGEVLLLKMAFAVPGQGHPFHATMTAIDKQFFCLSFSHDLRPLQKANEITVQKITQSWRSSIVEGQQQVARDAASPRP